MSPISARLPDELIAVLDEAATKFIVRVPM